MKKTGSFGEKGDHETIQTQDSVSNSSMEEMT